MKDWNLCIKKSIQSGEVNSQIDPLMSRMKYIIDGGCLFDGWSVFHWQFLIPIVSISLKFRACYITGQWGKIIVKNAFYTFLAFFCCFSSKNLCFYHFHFFFDEASNFRNRILSVELLGGTRHSVISLYYYPNP